MNRSCFAQFTCLWLRCFLGSSTVKMLRITGGAAASAAGLGGLGGSDREEMSARLQSILADALVSEDVQDALAKAGLLSIGLFSAMGSDDKSVKEFLADVVPNLDPGAIVDRAERAKVRMEITRICSAYSICKATHEVEVKVNAERAANMAPLIVSSDDFSAVKNAFELAEYKLTEEVSPSKPYFERKVSELSNEFVAEPLTMVTTAKQEETIQHHVPTVDPKTGFFRFSTKVLGVEMPRDAEEYRRRWETLGVCLWYVRAKASSRRVLQTVTMQRHDSILRWLFGAEVWGLATRAADGSPISTPTLQHVLTYELVLRQFVAKRMNAGVSWWDAWTEAMADTKLQQVSFLTHVAIRPSHTITAPGIRDPVVQTRDNSKAVTDVHPVPAPHDAVRTKNQISKDRKRRQLQSLKDFQTQALKSARTHGGTGPLMILDRQSPGGGRGGNPNGKGAGRGKGGKGGKVAAQFPDNALQNTTTTPSKPICIAHNKGNCTHPNCRYAHVCWFCEDPGHTGANHPAQ